MGLSFVAHFDAPTIHGRKTLDDYQSKWLILFSHPADLSMKVASDYGMIMPGASDTAAVRATFLIEPNGVLRAMVYYPMSNDRSIGEFKRLLVALQTADEHGVATPENWVPGDKVITYGLLGLQV